MVDLNEEKEWQITQESSVPLKAKACVVRVVDGALCGFSGFGVGLRMVWSFAPGQWRDAMEKEE